MACALITMAAALPKHAGDPPGPGDSGSCSDDDLELLRASVMLQRRVARPEDDPSSPGHRGPQMRRGPQDQEQTIELCSRKLIRDPSSVRVLLMRAQAYFRLGELPRGPGGLAESGASRAALGGRGRGPPWEGARRTRSNSTICDATERWARPEAASDLRRAPKRGRGGPSRARLIKNVVPVGPRG